MKLFVKLTYKCILSGFNVLTSIAMSSGLVAVLESSMVFQILLGSSSSPSSSASSLLLYDHHRQSRHRPQAPFRLETFYLQGIFGGSVGGDADTG